jgi:aromatic-amino-acid transaminase
VIEVLKARNLIPFLDIAYQGFGAGMEEDAYAIRRCQRRCLYWSATRSLKSSPCTASALAACPWSVKMPKPQGACWAS